MCDAMDVYHGDFWSIIEILSDDNDLEDSEDEEEDEEEDDE